MQKNYYTSVNKIKSCNVSLKHRGRRSTKQTSWQARKWWKVLLIPATLTQQQPPGASRGISAPQLKLVNKLSRRPERESVTLSLSLCPHLKITSLLHSVSTSSLLFFSSTSPNRWQSPGLMCPLSCRHRAKMQTHCETFLAVLIWVRLTRASRLFTRKDTAIPFPGVSLHGTFIGFLGCVYALVKSWWNPREEVKVSVTVSVLDIAVS